MFSRTVKNVFIWELENSWERIVFFLSLKVCENWDYRVLQTQSLTGGYTNHQNLHKFLHVCIWEYGNMQNQSSPIKVKSEIKIQIKQDFLPYPQKPTGDLLLPI